MISHLRQFREARQRAPASVLRAAVLVSFLLASDSADALNTRDVVGELNGEPVTLADVDAAMDGAIRQRWREMRDIQRVSARAICATRVIQHLALASQVDAMTWRARIWEAAAPQEGKVGERLAQAGLSPEAGHAARVRDYRERVAHEIDPLLSESFRFARPEASGPLNEEPVLPPAAADCLGTSITAQEIERFAAYPLYRRRAEVTDIICRQFTVDYSNPVLMHRIAMARGMTRQELIASVEAGVPPPDETEVESLARARYGNTDTASLSKVRIALIATRRAHALVEWTDELRKSTTARCALDRPGPPIVHLFESQPKLASDAALRVVLFGSFRCRHCEQEWKIARMLRDRWGASIRFELRHHFPDAARSWFDDALEAECSGRQGRLSEYVQWRYSRSEPVRPLVAALDLEPSAFKRCIESSLTAVEILAQTQDAQRLGFRDAMPSWVVGRRPRQGFQGEDVLNQTIEAELEVLLRPGPPTRSESITPADANRGMMAR